MKAHSESGITHCHEKTGECERQESKKNNNAALTPSHMSALWFFTGCVPQKNHKDQPQAAAAGISPRNHPI